MKDGFFEFFLVVLYLPRYFILFYSLNYFIMVHGPILIYIEMDLATNQFTVFNIDHFMF